MKTKQKSLVKVLKSESKIVTRITRHVLEFTIELPDPKNYPFAVLYDRTNGTGENVDCIRQIAFGPMGLKRRFVTPNDDSDGIETLGSIFNDELEGEIGHLFTSDEWQYFFDDLCTVIEHLTGIKDAW